MALHALEAHPDVGLDVLHDVADVERAVGVGQGGGDEELAGWAEHGGHVREGTGDFSRGCASSGGRHGAAQRQMRLESNSCATLRATHRDLPWPSPKPTSQALHGVIDPNTGKDFVSTKAVKNLQVDGGDVAFDVELGYPAKSQIAALRKALIAAARGVPGVANVSVNVATEDHRARGAARRAAAAEGQEHRRRRLGQGRRRQEHDRGQPGAGAGRRGRDASASSTPTSTARASR